VFVSNWLVRAESGIHLQIMNKNPVWKLTLGGLFLVLSTTTGCQKKDQSPATTESSSTPTPGASPVVSVESTSFAEVGKHLDVGGIFYLYLSTEKLLAGLQARVDEFQRAALAYIPPGDSEERAKTVQIASLLKSLLRESGIESITGIGASSIAIDPDLYLNKFFVHHPADKGEGFLWNFFGERPHPLDSLDLLPKNTAIGSFSDIDLQGLLQFLHEAARKSGLPEATQAIARASSTVEIATGMTLEELTAATGKQWGIILTLDSEKSVSLPVEGKLHTYPVPRAAILLRVPDEKIFSRIDRIASLNPQIEKIDEDGLKMLVMPLPFMPELELRPAAAQWSGWLIVSSHESLVRQIIAAKGGGLRTTAQFKRLSSGLPAEGNGFTIATEEFAKAVLQVQKSSVPKDASTTPVQMNLLASLMEWQKPGVSYSVSARLDDGVLVVNKANIGASQFLAPFVVIPIALGARAAVLPVLSRVQDKAKATKSLANATEIVDACRRYAADHDGNFPKELKELVGPYIADGLILISPFKNDEVGYTYTSGLTESGPPDTILLKDIFAPDAGFEITVKLDGRGKIGTTRQ
jgi:hypothetical protein